MLLFLHLHAYIIIIRLLAVNAHHVTAGIVGVFTGEEQSISQSPPVKNTMKCVFVVCFPIRLTATTLIAGSSKMVEIVLIAPPI